MLILGSSAEHRALRSSELFAHQAKHTKARARVIVRGTDAQIDDLAYRHKLLILRRSKTAPHLAMAINAATRTAGAKGAPVVHEKAQAAAPLRLVSTR